MHRLPTKTKPPVRMHSNSHQHGVNGHAPLEPRALMSSPIQLPSCVPPLRLLRFPAIRERTGLSRSTIWRLERRGQFPRHRRISANAVAWVEEEVMRWICLKIGNLAV
jgi:prophage regulatory protein